MDSMKARTISARRTRASACASSRTFSPGWLNRVHLVEPEVVAHEVVVRRVVRVPPQVPEVLHQHERRVVEKLKTESLSATT
jgi:hypothetical protein